MTERGLPIVDGAPACPFVAFEDERDERSSSPDHRHRCYAEVRPAPRALAHQEAYCLSSAFPVCPTFQEWAKREAARARAAQEQADADAASSAGGRGTWSGSAITPAAAAAAGLAGGADAMGAAAGTGAAGASGPDPRATSDAAQGGSDRAGEWTDDRSGALPPRRNPPRDWAAPPPWAGGPAGSAPSRGRTPAGDVEAPDFLAAHPTEGRGLAGSAADRIAAETAAEGRSGDGHAGKSRREDEAGGSASRWGPTTPSAPAAPVPPTRPETIASAVTSGPPGRAQAPDEELAALVRGRRDPVDPVDDREYVPVSRTGPRPAVSSTREHELEREREREAALAGPSWERPRRFEAYPTIKTRGAMPALPRIAVMAVALAISALALFFLPALLGIGSTPTGGPGAGASGSPQATTPVESASIEPTTPPAATPQVYVIKSGDTLSKIAKRFGITLEELLEANKETIKNPNRIAIGDQINIPAPLPDEFTDPGASAEPSAAP
jgi:LysM repeat protein